MSRWKLSFCLVAIFVLALAGRAEASCESEHRIAPANSTCLTATHNNSGWNAKNECSHTIKVKVDIARHTDKNKELASGESWRDSIATDFGVSVRGVYCCSDYSSCN